MTAPDTSTEALMALAERLERRPLYEGHGEESDLPEETATALRAIVAERGDVRVAIKPINWTEFANVSAGPLNGRYGDDNLAVALCSYFDRHLDCPDGDEGGAELDEFECWKVWVSENAEHVLRRIASTANDLMDARIRAEPFPALGAAAMREAAFSAVPIPPKFVIQESYDHGVADCAHQARLGICALSLPDHAALLRDAVKLPEIAAVVEALRKIADRNEASGWFTDAAEDALAALPEVK